MSFAYYSKACLAGLVAAAKLQGSTSLDYVPADLDNPSLPWDNFRSALSADAKLIAASNQDWVDQCLPFPPEELGEALRVNGMYPGLGYYAPELLQGPSGLCVSSMACAFKNCFPFTSTEDVPDGLDYLPDFLDPSNPRYNIPSSVLFPAVVGDVVAAVKFAADNGLQLSVKTSGHNYNGASTKKDTLLVYTRDYKKYSPSGIVECTNTAILVERSNNIIVNQDLSNQACLLTLARNKKAYIRVGGGENWGEVYGSVRAFNLAQDPEQDPESFKYHVVGGNVVTVTPMGWTFGSGNSGTTAGRLYGIGVDQVLQIEAVLPNGQHVRFGPTLWEDAEGYTQPKTLSVSGVCNTNPEGDEADWSWEPCPMEINFNDLWFAFRGGGGGTWGIVTSMSLQLHDYARQEVLSLNAGRVFIEEGCNVPQEEYERGIYFEFVKFHYNYLLDPESLGVSKADGYACGAPAPFELHCYGAGTGMKYASSWSSYIQNKRDELLGMNISETSIDLAAGCLGNQIVTYDHYSDYAEANWGSVNGPPPALYPPAGASPNFGTGNFFMVPMSFFSSDKENFYEFLKECDEFGGRYGPAGAMLNYFAFAGYSSKFTDQTTSASKVHHDALGVMVLPNPTVLGSKILEAYGITSQDTEIPGMQNGNYGFFLGGFGPLKSDPTKICDLTQLSIAEAEEQCFSHHEMMWGTDNLARLEGIKEAIDPNYIFDCQLCVGSNRGSKNNGSSPEETDATPETNEPAGETDVGDVTPETNDNDSSGAFRGAMDVVVHVLAVVAVLSFVVY